MFPIKRTVFLCTVTLVKNTVRLIWASDTKIIEFVQSFTPRIFWKFQSRDSRDN